MAAKTSPLFRMRSASVLIGPLSSTETVVIRARTILLLENCVLEVKSRHKARAIRTSAARLNGLLVIGLGLAFRVDLDPTAKAELVFLAHEGGFTKFRCGVARLICRRRGYFTEWGGNVVRKRWRRAGSGSGRPWRRLRWRNELLRRSGQLQRQRVINFFGDLLKRLRHGSSSCRVVHYR